MWRAVVSQPFDRTCTIEAKGDIDKEAGEFWVENTFLMPRAGHNLSAFESNKMFLNINGERFMDVSFACAAAIDSDSRSAVAADFDGDHDMDILVGNVGGGPLRLFMNDFPVQNQRVRIKLVTASGNRSAIGSRVTLLLQDGRKIVRDWFTTNGFRGQAPVQEIIGLGAARKINSLTVRWPDGHQQTLNNLDAGFEYTIHQGDDDLQQRQLNQ